MIGRILLCLICLCLAQSAAALTVEVRSGEHADFTRIIIDLPKRIQPTLEQGDGRATLTLKGAKLDFDTSAVFHKIPRERLTDIAPGVTENSLELTFGCPCEVVQFWHGDALLVLDISMRQDTDPISVQPAATEPTRPMIATEIKPDMDKATPLALPQKTGTFAASLAAAQFEDHAVDTANSQVGDETDQTDGMAMSAPAPDTHLAESRDRLLQQLGRAATQGLLSPRSSYPGTPVTTPAKARETQDAAPEMPTEMAVEDRGKGPSANINLKAQSSIDRDFLTQLAAGFDTQDGASCLAAAQIDLPDWGSDAPFAEQLGALRINLSGEFDKTNQDVARDLTRLYLYFGFGAEARQTLALIKDHPENQAVLADMAAIMEDGHAPEGSVLSGQLSCETPAALWSALSYRALPADASIETDAILRAFSALPRHQRSHLGPDLARRMMQAGYRDEAENLLRILSRGDETTTPGTNLVQAEIEIAQGDDAAADATLHDVVQTNSEPSAEALLKRIDARLASGEDISLEMAQLAGAYAHENQNTPIGRDLTRAYVLALASSGGFEKSLQELDRLIPTLDAADISTIRSHALGLLTDRADQMTFLRYALGNRTGEPALLDPQVSNAAASRLLTLGFIDPARRFVSPPATPHLARDRQMIRARISLASGRPRQAEVDLLGLTGADANILRAEARSLVGEHAAAQALFALGRQEEKALQEAWLAEDWAELGATGNPILASVARLVTAPQEPVGASDTADATFGILARNRSLLEQSLAARETIEALLASKDLPETLIE